MVPKTDDGRVLFAVPWHNHVVVGTTDTPLPRKSLEPRPLESEREFVLSHAAHYLVKDPSEDDILSVFAGLRPLVKSGDGSDTSSLSRDHTILVSESGLITVTGGKWTTYRRMGEDVVDQAEMVAGIENRDCNTKHLQIHGWTKAEIKEPNLAVYGSDAAAVREVWKSDKSLGEKLHPDLPYQKGEVLWHAREEMAQTVEDVLARRTRALLLNVNAAKEAAPLVAEMLASELGKDAQWQEDQVKEFRTLAKGYDYKDPASIMPAN
jgi:glycerol-3-phosphate dehydrogenase